MGATGQRRAGCLRAEKVERRRLIRTHAARRFILINGTCDQAGRRQAVLPIESATSVLRGSNRFDPFRLRDQISQRLDARQAANPFFFPLFLRVTQEIRIVELKAARG